MAPKRTPRRVKRASSSSEDEGAATERETTPQPQPLSSGGSRRRISNINDDGATPNTNGKRAPLQSVNMNDDAAEKRKRRQSQKVTMILPEDDQPVAGPSSEGMNGAGPADGVDGTAATPRRGLQRLDSVAQVDAPLNVPLDVMSSNFEEWMKMATDNKINAANSWNFALIDYFHDMSLLRNQDDNTINFQRASCTLDGCVKIWTSRVDSVGTETTKLLSNIAQGGRGADDDHDANPDGEGSDGEGGEGGGTQRVKKKRGPGATLAKDPAQLRNKKPDLEFSVDPLFKKTCADFDEGGAQGLLMSHLALGVTQDGSLRIVFDASDAQPRRSDEEEDDLQEPEEQIDLELLRAEFFPDLSVLEDAAISHSLAGFTFGQDVALDNVKLGLANGLDSDDEDFGAQPPPPQYDGDVPMDGEGGDFAPLPVEDFFMGDQAVEDDYGGDVDAFAGREEERSESGSVAAFGGQYAGGGGGGANAPLVAFDPRRPSEQQFVEAMAAGDSNSLDYFDRGFVKNWAGPEHWKLRRPIPKTDAAGGTTKGKQKEKKEAFRIDFTSEQEGTFKQRTKTLFAGVTKGATINLPIAARRKIDKEDKEELKDKDLNLLPDDMHFTSRSLVTLFLKPGFQLKMRGKVVLDDNNGEEIDADYWARAAERAADADAEPDSESVAPFPTQFFNDDDDDVPGFEDPYDGGVIADGVLPAAIDDEQDLLAGSQGPKPRVKPEFVNYAKRAKRVDVRKLKENIWKGLDIIVPEPKEEEDMDDDKLEPEGTDPAEAREFGNVVSNLRSMYPREKMDEISTSFCFICLLHLANERGLKLEVDEDGMPVAVDDDKEGGFSKGKDKRVGELANLKVYRDADALPAA